MQDSSELQEMTNEQADLTPILQNWIGLMNDINRAGRDEVVGWLSKMTPVEQANILSKMSGTLQLIYEERNSETLAPLLAALKMVAESINTTSSLGIYYFWQAREEQQKRELRAAIGHYVQSLEGLEDSELRTVASFNLALALHDSGDLDRAKHQFQETLRVAQEHHDDFVVASCYFGLVRIADARNDRSQLRKWLEQAHRVAEATQSVWMMAEYHFWQGRLEQDENRLESAIDHYEKAVGGLRDPLRLTEALHALAMIWFRTGNIVKAELLSQQLIEVAKEYSLTQAMGYGYLSLAEAARIRNDIPEAISNLEQAQQYSQKVNDPKLTALIITQQGLIYAQDGNLLLAQEYYQQLDVYLQSTQMSEELLKRARSSLMLNKARLAERRKQEILQQLAEPALEDQALQAEIEKIRNLTQDAQQYAEKALADQSVLTGIEYVENLALASTILFNNSTEIGELPLVTQHLLSAFRRAEEMRYASGLLMIGELLALIYGLRGYFEPAHRVCAVAIDALERQRSQVGDETDRLQYIQYRMDIFEQMILLCLILTQLKHVSDYQQQALFYAERAKSRTFIELLGRTTNIAPPSNLPPELLQKEGQVLNQLRALEISMRSLMDIKEQEQMERAYNAAQIELDEIWKQTADIAPEYAALRRGQPVTFDGVRRLLKV
jgi:tetratricopeptide (TPR) repeat protein